jgi:hypothetical protein
MREIVVEKKGSMKAMLGALGFSGQPVNMCVEENAEKFGIDLFFADADFKDVERTIGGDRALVGPV